MSAGESRDDGPRWPGVALLAVGLAVNEYTLERTVVPDGDIGSGALRIALVGFQVACVALGTFVIVRRPRLGIPWRRLLLGGGSAALTWFVCFAVVDSWRPGLLEVPGMRYYAEYRQRYVPDSTLVMTPRRTGHSAEYDFEGDLSAPGDGLAALDIQYRASYNEIGFRVNSASGPYDAVVIGDSFVEFGETDRTTISELIRDRTGLATFNLGRGWYGPYQYLELLRRHGLDLGPDFALFFFFEGNDLEDTRQYADWKNGGSYYRFSVIEGGLMERFLTFHYWLLAEAQWGIAAALASPDDETGHPTYRVSVDGGTRRMRFAYWPDHSVEPARLMRRSGWDRVSAILSEYRSICQRNGIVPVVVFVPAKISVYRNTLSRAPRDSVSSSRTSSRPRETTPRAVALRRLARRADLPFLDLTPVLRERAGTAPLLYYAQDTHWSLRGREVAAEAVAGFLEKRWPALLGTAE